MTEDSLKPETATDANTVLYECVPCVGKRSVGLQALWLLFMRGLCDDNKRQCACKLRG